MGLKKTIIHQPNHPLKIAMSDSPNWSYYNYRKPINKAKRLTTVILMPRQLCYNNTTAIACSYQIFSSDIGQLPTLQQQIGCFNHRLVTLVANKTVVMRGLLRLED